MPPTVPPWLPRGRIWVGLSRWGVEHAATVIESRVQEAGGTPKELTAADMAVRAVREMREATERDAFLNSPKGVEAAQREFDGLFEEVQRVCAASSGLIVKPSRDRILVVMETTGVLRKATFAFRLAVSNSLQGFELDLIEFDSTLPGPGSNQHTPFHFDFGPSGELGWREGKQQGTGEFFATSRLVDDVAKKLIKAIHDKGAHRQRPNSVAW